MALKKSYKVSNGLTPEEMTKQILSMAKNDGFKNFKLEVSISSGEMVGDKLIGNDMLDNTITVTLTENEEPEKQSN